MADIQRSEQLAQRLIRAFGNRGSDEDLFTPDCTIWHNAHPVDRPRGAASDSPASRAPDLRLDQPQVRAWADGFVIEATIRATLPDRELDLPVAMVATIRDDRIARVQEYTDTARGSGAPAGNPPD